MKILIIKKIKRSNPLKINKKIVEQKLEESIAQNLEEAAEKTPEAVEKTPEAVEKTPEAVEKTPEAVEKTAGSSRKNAGSSRTVEKTPEEPESKIIDTKDITLDKYIEISKFVKKQNEEEFKRTRKNVEALQKGEKDNRYTYLTGTGKRSYLRYKNFNGKIYLALPNKWKGKTEAFQLFKKKFIKKMDNTTKIGLKPPTPPAKPPTPPAKPPTPPAKPPHTSCKASNTSCKASNTSCKASNKRRGK